MTETYSKFINDVPVETKNFAEDKNQDHANEDPRLLHISTNASVADNSDAVTGGKTSHADCNATSEMKKTTNTVSVRFH